MHREAPAFLGVLPLGDNPHANGVHVVGSCVCHSAERYPAGVRGEGRFRSNRIGRVA